MTRGIKRPPYYWRWNTQRENSKRRGIAFHLTFAQWLAIWTKSGHIDESGKQGHQYVMARNNDAGPYRVGNVRIITARENALENHKRREATQTPQARAKRADSVRRDWAKLGPRKRRARIMKGVRNRPAAPF